MMIPIQLFSFARGNVCLRPQSATCKGVDAPSTPQNPSIHFPWSLLTNPPKLPRLGYPKQLPSVLIFIKLTGGIFHWMNCWFDMLTTKLGFLKASTMHLTTLTLLIAIWLSFISLPLNWNSFLIFHMCQMVEAKIVLQGTWSTELACLFLRFTSS